MSSVAERDPDVDAVLLAVFDTAVGAGLDDVPRPADPDFAGAPGFGVPTVFGEGLADEGLGDEGLAVELGGDVAAPVFGVAGAAEVLVPDGTVGALDWVPAVDVGPVVCGFDATGGEDVAAALGIGDGDGVVDVFVGAWEVLVLGCVDGAARWLEVPFVSDGAVLACDGPSLGGPPTWLGSSRGAPLPSG